MEERFDDPLLNEFIKREMKKFMLVADDFINSQGFPALKISIKVDVFKEQ